jgi:purine-binding chemotaxis protein CheW
MKKDRQRSRPEKLDWQAIRRRLDKTLAAAEGAHSLSSERARQVMDERARALARVPARGPDAAAVLQVVVFSLANERYALEARFVQRVVPFSEYTPVPGAPDFLVGVFNLRGEVLAVIDLRKFFGVPARALTEQSRVLVLGGERAEFGVLADATDEVAALRTDDVLEPPDSVAGIGREYLRGVTRDALIVLDGAVLLQDRRLFIDQGGEVGF